MSAADKLAEALRVLLDCREYGPVSDRADAWHDARAALAAYEAEAKPAEPVVTQTPIAARKVAALIEQGWKPVGYVMDKEGERTAITIDAAVAWLTTQDVYRLMFIDGRVVELPAAAPAAPAGKAQPLNIDIDRGRVWIKRGNQSFMMAYEGDEDELQWYCDRLKEALSGITPDVKTAPAAPAPSPDWRELTRRLFVELWHCDRQMMSVKKYGKPVFQQGQTVRDVLADAKAALEASKGGAA